MTDIEQLVVACAAGQSGVDLARINAETDLIRLGMGGDDGADLIQLIRERSGAKLAGFDAYSYFGDEATFGGRAPTSLTVRQLARIVEADLAIQ